MLDVPLVLLALKFEGGRMKYKVTSGLARTMVRVVMYVNMGMARYLVAVKVVRIMHNNRD